MGWLCVSVAVQVEGSKVTALAGAWQGACALHRAETQLEYSDSNWQKAAALGTGL